MTRRRAGFTLKKCRDVPRLAFAGARMQAFLDARDTPALSCYRISLPGGGRIRPAYHERAVELIWVIRGGGTARLGEARVRLRRGDALVIHPPTPHGFVAGPRGMAFLASLSPRVDSRTDYHSCDGEHAPPRVLAGRWDEGRRDRR